MITAVLAINCGIFAGVVSLLCYSNSPPKPKGSEFGAVILTLLAVANLSAAVFLNL